MAVWVHVRRVSLRTPAPARSLQPSRRSTSFVVVFPLYCEGKPIFQDYKGDRLSGKVMRINDQLFPFRFQFDRELVVTEIGPSLKKIIGSCEVGCSIESLARLSVGDWPDSFEAIRELIGSSFDVTIAASQVAMRCQLVEVDNELAVVGSPRRLRSLEELEELGLGIDDFAGHDAAVDLLMLRDAQQVTLEEHRDALLDIHDCDGVNRSLEQSKASLVQTLNMIGDVMLTLDESGTILEASASRTQLLPDTPHALQGQSIHERCPQFSRPIRNAISELEESCGVVPFSFEISRENEYIYFDADLARTPRGEYVILARDVTRQRQLRAELTRRANHDALTGLPNRTYFLELAEEALESPDFMAVFFIDLDGFKAVNDRHGHQMGDELLIHVARTIKNCLGTSDCAARLGGDEFSILLRSVESKQAAERVAARVLSELQQPARVGHRMISSSASIGIATNYDSKDISTLFQFADIAMYEAKARHKCCHVVFESTMYEEFVRRDTLQQQLLAAGKQGQFVNHYQPIVDIVSGRTVGFEALCRWQHPIRGLLMPTDFIESAEESDAIIRVGEHTVANACDDLGLWKAAGLLTQEARPQIHVNVSAIQLVKGCLPTMLKRTLEEFGVERERITVEVKEQTLQEHFETARTEISKLHDMGFKVAIDDFGAGNSSLAFLDRLPVDGIKLARSFVGYLGETSKRNCLVRAVVELALEFDLEVIAVGVETETQCDLLRSFGCELAQGDLFSQPVCGRDKEFIGSQFRYEGRTNASADDPNACLLQA